MTVEDLAFKMFERQAQTFTDDDTMPSFVWQMEDGTRQFWIAEARAVMEWLEVPSE